MEKLVNTGIIGVKAGFDGMDASLLILVGKKGLNQHFSSLAGSFSGFNRKMIRYLQEI